METFPKHSNRINGILVLLAFLFGIAVTTFLSTNTNQPLFLDMWSSNKKAGSTQNTEDTTKPKITGPTASSSPQLLTGTPVASTYQTTPSKLKDLTVKWLKDPIKISPADIGLTAAKTLSDTDIKDIDKAFTIYQVGTITSAPFANKRLLLVYVYYDNTVTGKSQLHVVDDHLNKGLIALRWNQQSLTPSQQKIFTANFEYDIPALHLPPRLSITYQGSNLSFEAEDFGVQMPVKEFIQSILTTNTYPLPGLVDAQLVRSKGITLTHPQYGPLVELPSKGYFYLQRPDTTVMLYHLSAPISPIARVHNYDPAAYSLSLTFNDNSNTYRASYSNALTNGSKLLCPPQGYFVFDDKIKNHLIAKGTFMNIPFFELNPNDALYDALFSSLFPDNPTYNNAMHEEHPFIFTQDALGRWMGLINTNIINIQEGECANVTPNTL